MNKRALLLYFAIFLAAALITPWFGAESITVRDAAAFFTAQSGPLSEIFWLQRMPRLLLALIAGGTLAAVGASFQVMFHNPLVEPFTLGISGGSALGAFIAISWPSLWLVWGPFSSVQVFAALGAGGTLFLIYSLSRKRSGISVTVLLLAGVTISIICSGAILLLTYLASPQSLVVFQHWMMGGIDILGYRELAFLAPLLLPGLCLLFLHARDLNHLALSEEMALGHGVAVGAVRRDIFIGGGLATAAVVSLVGPIGFVGLIIPHAVRQMSGFDQRMVLPASFLLGGAVLAVSDTFARTLIAPTELPVGIITAILGGPLFIYLLVAGRTSMRT